MSRQPRKPRKPRDPNRRKRNRFPHFWATKEEYSKLMRLNPGFWELKCKVCESKGILFRTVMHIGLYCPNCLRYLTWLKNRGILKDREPIEKENGLI